MKRKILFIMPSMFIGGAERSLLGLLDSFDYEKWEVALFLYRHEGEFLKYIPEKVIILPEMKEYNSFDTPVKKLLCSKMFLFGFQKIIGKFAKKIHCAIYGEKAGVWMSMQYISRFLLPLLPPIPGDYDIAISFLGIPDVLLKKTNSRKKIAWNHTDYSVLGPDKKYDRSLYSKIDYIASVSEPCTKQFLRIYPEYEKKAITIHNIISDRLLFTQAEESIEDKIFKEFNGIKLLSIGRFSDAKNFDNVPAICKEIIENGLNIKWFLIGYGSDEMLIRQKIEEYSMQDRVIILGKKENPYPYIKACNLYVQPSRYEGKCVSVLEAQILNKPVIITRYATSSSQLRDGFDGIIVPMKNKEAGINIANFLRNKDIQKKIISNTKKTDYTNKSEIERIYSLFD